MTSRLASLLKRVVAVGGETIACCDTSGKVTVDGKPLAEPHAAQDAWLDEPPNPNYCGPRRSPRLPCRPTPYS